MPFPIFDKKDDIPKGAEDVYEERNGKWHPKIEDVTPLKTAIEKERSDRKKAEDQAREASEKAADLERKLTAAAGGGGDKDQIAKALKKFDDDLAAAKAEGKKESDALRTQLRTLQLDDKAKAAFIKAGGRPERADAMLKLNRDRLDLVDDRIVIKNAKGETTTETVEDFFAKSYKTEMPDFYKGTQASGGGASGGSGGGSGAPMVSAEELLKDPLAAMNKANEAAAAK